jgi:hypothetical protein
MVKGRGMIKGRHLTLFEIFKTTVFTTKYMIMNSINIIIIYNMYVAHYLI